MLRFELFLTQFRDSLLDLANEKWISLTYSIKKLKTSVRFLDIESMTILITFH